MRCKDEICKDENNNDIECDSLSRQIFLVASEVFSSVVIVIAIVIIVFTLTYLFQIKIQNKLYANIFGYTILQVKSGSMGKEILIGDLVVVQVLNNSNSSNNNSNSNNSNNKDVAKTSPTEDSTALKTKQTTEHIKNNIAKNDVITFEKENFLITHRVLELNEDNLVTKGDANNTEDKPIEYTDVIGKVVNIIPNIAVWEQVFSEKTVIIPLVGGITLLIFAVLIDTNETIKEKKELNGKKRTKIQKGKRFKE